MAASNTSTASVAYVLCRLGDRLRKATHAIPMGSTALHHVQLYTPKSSGEIRTFLTAPYATPPHMQPVMLSGKIMCSDALDTYLTKTLSSLWLLVNS